MRIVRFEAPSVQEALLRVRQELGPEAVILYTKKIKKGGFLGFGAQELAEVTAGVDLGPESNASATQASARPDNPLPVQSPIVPAPSTRRPDVFQSELNDGKVLAGVQLVRNAPKRQGPELHPELRKVMDALLRNGVEEAVALNALLPAQKEIQEQGYPRTGGLGPLVKRILAGQLKAGGPLEATPGRPKVIAFIGPTGVGKTTTLVKLASQFSLVQQLKVALLTADTYRIGAVEQLRIYRDIIDIPFEAVNEPAELGPALRRHADRDLIFFDTAGRSPQNRRQIQDLRSFLDAARPAETHLCISATTKNADLLSIVGKFGLVPVNRFLITKLDETRTHGLLLNLAANFDVPVGYITTGQNVPNDIETATGDGMADLVLGGAFV